ncbi:polysaccharide biosynthesis tyrosine autokinase [Flavobacteriaceae bacterium]|nr:polysaccharide biosynthesis tyrosine autokinase [Flavobacteriaceae bacterium]
MPNSPVKFDFDQINAFDFKEYLLRIVSYWKIFVLSVVVALAIARFKNGYEQRQFTIGTLVILDEEKNPLFTGSTNIAFNWGGASNKVEAVKAKFMSRTHNESVVRELDYYIDYLEQGKYRLNDAYGNVPFKLKINHNGFQLFGRLFEIVFISSTEFKINLVGEETPNYLGLIKYSNLERSGMAYRPNFFEQTYTVDQGVHNELFDFDIEVSGFVIPRKQYLIRFNSFDGTVNRYRAIRVNDYKMGTSLLNLSLSGPNKTRLVEYLNTSVSLLDLELQNAKISYAVRTKKYIDTLFRVEEEKLRSIEGKIQDFKKENDIYSLNTSAGTIFQKITAYDNQRYQLQSRRTYYINLKNYLKGSNDMDNDVIAPSLIDIEDPNISISTAKLIELSQEKAILESSVTSEHPAVVQVNKDIAREKRILEEHIDEMILNLTRSIADIDKELEKEQSKIQELPEKEQKLINYERTQSMNEVTYNYLKQKSYEAGSAIASNVSELKVIDSAKDIGQGFTTPRIEFNYMVALLLGVVLPLIFVIVVDMLNDKVDSIEELKSKFKIPVLGTVGSIRKMEHLIVFNKPKSSIAESFRILRSNIYFLYNNKNKNKEESKTVLVTSSISGEGKTTIAVNLATIYALSGKKTLLVNMDLRKPRMHEEFDAVNKRGVVNILVGSEEIKDVLHPTDIANLDVVFSGPVPPNPSELIMNSSTEDFLTEAANTYDRVVIDSSPMGLVSDTLELIKYSDANLYVVRQGYTKKGMLKMIEEKYKEGEVKNISYVMNFFNSRGKYGYGYDYGKYGYGYIEDKEIPFYRKWFKKN